MPPFAKRMIKQSFIRLLNERPLSQITVKEIVEDCGVNRNSFYNHFQDIPSLLEEIIMELADKVIRSLPEDAGFEDQVTVALHEIVKRKKVIYHIFISANSNKDFYELQMMKICEYVARNYIGSRDYAARVPEEDLEYVIHFLKTLAYGQLIDWIHHDMAYDIVDHSRRLCRMFAGTMQNACLKY